MDFDIIIGSLGHFHIKLAYDMQGDKTDIYVKTSICSSCGQEIYESGSFLLHQLEHEIVEVLTNSIRWEDGERKFDSRGFDLMCLQWHKKKGRHKCNGFMMEIYCG